MTLALLLAVPAALLLADIAAAIRADQPANRIPPLPGHLAAAYAVAPDLARLPGWLPPDVTAQAARSAAAAVHQEIGQARADMHIAWVLAGLRRREPATPAAYILATWWLPAAAPVDESLLIGQHS